MANTLWNTDKDTAGKLAEEYRFLIDIWPLVVASVIDSDEEITDYLQRVADIWQDFADSKEV